MIGVVSYYGTSNLGDAIQTIAMAEYLKNYGIIDYEYVYRQSLRDNMIINGWHRYAHIKLPNKATYLSIHTDKQHLKNIDKNIIVGCRDSWTLENCKQSNVEGVLTGCVSIIFPLSDKKKEKTLFIDSIKDVSSEINLTQKIEEKTPWNEQINLAHSRLGLIAKASLVHTTRLHILLPCIAMGIPVILDKVPNVCPERFTFFTDLIPINKPIELSSGIREELIDIWKINSSKIMDFTHF
jgi:exopolysaccharide biosynthesis predicted pyruvyltransferase EpsI